MVSETVETKPGDLKNPIRIILAVSAAAFALLLWILYGYSPLQNWDVDVSFMPAMNAGINATATTLLIVGFVAIRARNIKLHMACMISTMVLSAAFLVSYLLYHSVHGSTPYPGEGIMRYIYFGVLISHVGLTVFALPLIITTFFLAFTKRFDMHPKVARVALPIWLYVSITGVLIFVLLRTAG